MRRKLLDKAPHQALLDGVVAPLDELGDRNAERASDIAQEENRRVSVARFEPCQVTLRDPRAL